MSGTKDDPSGSSWTRANEVTEAMLGLQPYADDSMLFLMRYGDKVKRSLRQADHEDFFKTLGEMMQLWSKSTDVHGGPEERSRKAADLRQRCLDLVKGFPDLERDFDRFVISSRAATRVLNNGPT